MTMTTTSSAPEGTDSSQATAPALRRSIQILDLVATSEGTLTATEIARLLHLPKSTAHGLIKAMLELDLLTRFEGGRFGTGAKFASFSRAKESSDIGARFYDMMSRRSQFHSFTMTLVVLDRVDALYMACVNLHESIGLTFPLGTRLPACFTASGKVLLSALTPAELRELYAGALPDPLTVRSTRSIDELDRELAEVRERGYCISVGRVIDGVSCFAAPVLNRNGKIVAAISASTFSNLADPCDLDSITLMINECALELSH